MTVSKHVYSAVLIGTPDLPLSVRGGTITLDAGVAPHVTATLEIAVPGHWAAGPTWTPDPSTLAALDPRLTPRIRIDVAATFETNTQTRSFNLGLRERTVNHADGIISITLTSDEALLGDYAPLAADLGAFAHQGSLRAVVDYVLGEAIPGAALEATPGDDADVTSRADAENLIRNPRVAAATTDWYATWTTGGLSTSRLTSGGPADSPTYYAMGATSNTTGAFHYIDQGAVSVTGGQDYVLSVAVRSEAGVTVQVDAVLFDSSNTVIGYSTPSAVAGAHPAWGRGVTRFTTPQTAAKIRPRVSVVGTFPSGKFIDITGWRLSRDTGDPTDEAFFDGDTPGSAAYAYGWSDAAHASTSTRQKLTDAPTPDALTWAAGVSALDFLRPLVQVSGFRLVCDELRNWTLRAEEYSAPGALEVRYGVNLTAGADSISRDSGVWFDAAVTRYTWTDAQGVQRVRTDMYALNTPHTLLRTFDKETPYPGAGFSEYAVRRAQGRGREVTASAVSDWSAAAEQAVSVVLQDAPTQVGSAQSVTFDLSADEMTVTTRTTDTPVGAIDLLSGTIDALPGSVDSL